jgi:hypothetical protein
MARTSWKRRERQAAAMIGGRRYAANQGGAVDCESATVCAQVKERKNLSLAQIERLALEIERVGRQKLKPGVVMLKRSAGRGIETPWIIAMTASVYRELNGELPEKTG